MLGRLDQGNPLGSMGSLEPCRSEFVAAGVVRKREGEEFAIAPGVMRFLHIVTGHRRGNAAGAQIVEEAGVRERFDSQFFRLHHSTRFRKCHLRRGAAQRRIKEAWPAGHSLKGIERFRDRREALELHHEVDDVAPVPSPKSYQLFHWVLTLKLACVSPGRKGERYQR